MLCAVELVGPCRFGGWVAEEDEALQLAVGDPLGVEHPRAWIQVAAVNLAQNRNTMTLMPGLFSKACIAEHSIDIGKEIIYAHKGQRRIEAVTSSPKALEGGRPTFCLRNETHHWLSGNEGHEMAAVIKRNLVKAKGGQARGLSITNAYEPSDDSFAQRQREAWENEQSGLAMKTGMFYDSLEAPADAKLAWSKNEDGAQPSDQEIKDYIASVVRAVQGDAWWLDVDGIVAGILDGTTSPSESRRFYYNQIVAGEDAWLDPACAKAAIWPLAADSRAMIGSDFIRAGWLMMPDEEIVVFFDGSKSDDSTGLVGCRLSDGYVFVIGVWQKPAGDEGKGWLVPRHEVDNRVTEAFERFKIVAFFADPSHAKDDDASHYWDTVIDDWHRRFKDELTFWSVKTGDRQHAVMWDMTSPERTRQFVAAAELFVEELENEDGPQFTHDGNPALLAHLRNARRYPMRDGISLWKGGRQRAQKKIDLAVCAVGARMLRRLVLNRGLKEQESKAGRFWGV